MINVKTRISAHHLYQTSFLLRRFWWSRRTGSFPFKYLGSIRLGDWFGGICLFHFFVGGGIVGLAGLGV